MAATSGAWTFARVFKLMYEKRRTGVLEVLGPDGETRIHLQEGKVINVETTDGDVWRLGEFLTESDTVAQNELVRITRKARKSGRTVEMELLARRRLTEDILKRFVELDMRETIFPLFMKTGITCKFTDTEPTASMWAAPIPVAFFLKQAQKRSKAWPLLHKRIPHDDLVFNKVEAYVPIVLGQIEGLVVSEDEETREAAAQDHIGGNERIVYYYINGKKTVRQLAYASCLGEFETYEALVKLFEGGYVEVHSEHGKGERLKKKHVILPMVTRVIAYAIPAIVVAWMALIRPGALEDPAALVALAPPELDGLLARHGTARIDRALEAHFLATGEYPEHPRELVEAGLLEPAALEYSDAGSYQRIDGPPQLYRWRR